MNDGEKEEKLNKFHVNACVKLTPTEEDPINISEVPGEVGGELGKIIDSLYGEVLLKSIKELDTGKLAVVSIKIMPVKDILKITVNVMLDEAQLLEGEEKPTRHRKIDFAPTSGNLKRLNLHRLIKFMEAKALKMHSGQFESIVHVRVIRLEKSDLIEGKF